MPNEEHTRDQLTQKDHKWTTIPTENTTPKLLSAWGYDPLTDDLIQLWISNR